jgi:hypothetical protein
MMLHDARSHKRVHRAFGVKVLPNAKGDDAFVTPIVKVMVRGVICFAVTDRSQVVGVDNPG